MGNSNAAATPNGLKCDNTNLSISSPLAQAVGFTSSSPLASSRCQHLQQQQNPQFSSHSNSSNTNTSSSSSTSTKRKTKSKDSLLNSSFEKNLTGINFIDACSLIGNCFFAVVWSMADSYFRAVSNSTQQFLKLFSPFFSLEKF